MCPQHFEQRNDRHFVADCGDVIKDSSAVSVGVLDDGGLRMPADVDVEFIICGV